MKSPAVSLAAVVTGCIAGFLCSECLMRSVALRDHVAKWFGRGDLLALVNGRGIYQVDLERRLAESGYLAGAENSNDTTRARDVVLNELVPNIAAETRASHERVPRSQLDAQLNLLRFQFGDEKTWRAVLSKSGVSRGALRRTLKNNLEARLWIARQVSSESSVTPDECRQFYQSHLDQFFLPERRNVSHLFLAAPAGTPSEVVEAKRTAIQGLSARLSSGEDFARLAAENSEDDATKFRGGELGYFSAKGMPPEFVEAAARLRPGEISKP